MSDSRLYSRLLLPKGHGYPLFHPQPFDDLPPESLRVGTAIGDVGVVTSDGSFDVIFNICRAADDPVNRFGVPEGFEQVKLGPGDVAPRAQYHRPGSDVSNTKISKRRLDVDAGVESNVQVFLPLGAGAVVEITTSSKQAAVLLLPDGASRTDLRRLKKFRDYALKHGPRWYAFVNGNLERMVDNGDLYLVSGIDKSFSWSVAAVENHSEDCKISLKLKASPAGSGGTSCAWEWETANSFADSGPRRVPGDEGTENQTVFMRGFKVAIRSTPLKKSAKAISIVNSKPSDILSKAGGGSPFSQMRPTNTGSFFRSSTATGSGGTSDDEELIEECAEYVPGSPKVYHPASAINEHLLKSCPYADVAVTHDDEWGSVLSEHDEEFPDEDELIRRILRRYGAVVNSGGVCLQRPISQRLGDFGLLDEEQQQFNNFDRTSQLDYEALDALPTHSFKQSDSIAVLTGQSSASVGHQRGPSIHVTDDEAESHRSQYHNPVFHADELKRPSECFASSSEEGEDVADFIIDLELPVCDGGKPNCLVPQPRSSNHPCQTTPSDMELVLRLKSWKDMGGSVVVWTICVVLTLVAIAVLFEVTKHLILGDVDDLIPYTGPAASQIELRANYIEVDVTLRTVTVDWLSLPRNCSSNPEMIVNIFADPNLLVPAGWATDDIPSSSQPLVPIFQLNTTQGCQRTNYDSCTVLELTELSGSNQLTPRTGTLQAYPHDKYYFQVSLFAQMASTNASVGLVLGHSFGTPINYDVILDTTYSTNSDDGILFYFTVLRSAAVMGLVITIVIANWLVTIAFLWITVTAFMWETDIVAEMFVLPIATLFAFTSVRANFLGAPAGFGAVVDYYGILPNIGLIILFTAVLLFGVLYRRIASAISKKKPADPPKDTPPPNEAGDGSETYTLIRVGSHT